MGRSLSFLFVFFVHFVALHWRSCSALERSASECRTTASGSEYKGTKSVTSSGHTCLNWTSDTPQSKGYTAAVFRKNEETIEQARNYCRNPKNEACCQPWCYIGGSRWEQCNIPYCSAGGCWDDNGGCEQNCTNQMNRQYTCSCRPGYRLKGDQKTCEDIDECTSGQSGCQQTCVNTNGSYHCRCLTGYRMNQDRRTCFDIDECAGRNHGCAHSCVNTNGSYFCECLSGYRLETDRSSCSDVDECKENNNGGCQQTCVNKEGSFRCECYNGYTLQADGQCSDIDECHVGTSNCQQLCSNTPGNFSCSCSLGYKLNPDDSTCSDLDECEQNNGDCDHSCNNTEGSYQCWCDEGFSLYSDRHTCTSDDYFSLLLIIGGAAGTVLLIVIIFSIICKYGLGRHQRMRVRESYEKSTPPDTVNPVVVTLASGNLTANDDDEQSTDSMELYSNAVSSINPTFQAIKISELHKFVEFLRRDPNYLHLEFKSLPLSTDASVSFAKNPQLKQKNRFKNILPYDDNRVELKKLDGSPLSTYINASFIKDSSGCEKYIASHGPTSSTIEDFWRMVVENEVTVILMLTRCQENLKRKCEQYWPEKGATIEFNDITVTTESVDEWADYIIRQLKITCSPKQNVYKWENRTFRLTHIQFTDWADQGVPKQALPLLRIRRKINELFCSDGYLLVHCSAGVGRTGTYIATDILLQKTEVESCINVLEVIRELREQRMQCVQTLDQCNFVYEAVLEELTLGKSVVSSNDFSNNNRLNETNALTGELNIYTEFRMLQEMLPLPEKEECKCALSPQNVDKNRCLEYVPADDKRVRLIFGENKQDDYINAIFIQSHRDKHAYVATQLPLPGTMHDFWNMCIDYKCKTILLFERETEDNLKDFVDSTFEGDNAIINVQMLERKLDTVQIQSSSITIMRSTDVENVYANTMKSKDCWTAEMVTVKLPQSCETSRYTTLIKTHEYIDFLRAEDSYEHPTVVMCKDGVEMTGTYLALANTIDLVLSCNEVDVVRSVLEIRKSQPHFISTQESYEDVYKAVDFYLNQSSLYVNS